MTSEFTLEQAQKYVKDAGKQNKRFYRNVYGWDVYYTLKPTFATPTGKLKDFPRTRLIYRS